jgi:hypothetical protein
MPSNYDYTKGNEFWAAQKSTAGVYKPKTKFRVSFPPNDKIKLMNMMDVSAPGGLSIDFKLPFPMGEQGLNKLFESIKTAGGTVEVKD